MGTAELKATANNPSEEKKKNTPDLLQKEVGDPTEENRNGTAAFALHTL